MEEFHAYVQRDQDEVKVFEVDYNKFFAARKDDPDHASYILNRMREEVLAGKKARLVKWRDLPEYVIKAEYTQVDEINQFEKNLDDNGL